MPASLLLVLAAPLASAALGSAPAPAAAPQPAAPASPAPAQATPAQPLAAPAAEPSAPATPAPEAPTPDAPAPADAAPPAAAATAAPATAAPAPAAPATDAAPTMVITNTALAAHDPFERFNRFNYRISQPVDRFVVAPVTRAYMAVLPGPLRDGIHNAVNNLNEPVVFLNDLLQLRPGRALRTVLRFVINTAIGVGGLFDVAKRPYIGLPYHDNGFGETLGYYGVGPGPYIYLPVIGPSSPRDLVGGLGDLMAQPRLLGKMINPDNDKSLWKSSIHLGPYGAAFYIAGGLDERARANDDLKALKAGSVDPYAALRASWVQNRAGEIAALKARGNKPLDLPTLDDPLADPQPPAQPAPGAPLP